MNINLDFTTVDHCLAKSPRFRASFIEEYRGVKDHNERLLADHKSLTTARDQYASRVIALERQVTELAELKRKLADMTGATPLHGDSISSGPYFNTTVKQRTEGINIMRVQNSRVNKIAAIKALRQYVSDTGGNMGLADAKNFVEHNDNIMAAFGTLY